MGRLFIPARNNHYAVFKLHSLFSCSIIFMKDIKYNTNMSELFRIRKETGNCCCVQHDAF